MPFPLVGGTLAVKRVAPVQHEVEMELKDCQLQRQFIQTNVKCNLKFLKKVTPFPEGRVKGMVLLEAMEDVDLEHRGMFLQLEGLSSKRGNKGSSILKFPVLSGKVEEGDRNGNIQIEGGTREMYPFEIALPEDLPQPLITPLGKFSYYIQVFISSIRGEHVPIGEAVTIKWQESRLLTREEVDSPFHIQQELGCRRRYFRLQRKTCAHLEWRVEKGGYIPGDTINVALWGNAKSKAGVVMKCKVEVVQRVLYQILPSKEQKEDSISFKKRVSVVAAVEENVAMMYGKDIMKVAWQTCLRVHKGLAPSCNFDEVNSISYTLRIGVTPEIEESWVVDEVPIVIGSSREVDTGKCVTEDDLQEDQNEMRLPSTSNYRKSSGTGSYSGMPEGSTRVLRSGSMTFTSFQTTTNDRKESVSSVESWRSFASGVGAQSTVKSSPKEAQITPVPSTIDACKNLINRLKRDVTKSFKFLIFLVPATSYELDLPQQQGMMSLTQEGDSRKECSNVWNDDASAKNGEK